MRFTNNGKVRQEARRVQLGADDTVTMWHGKEKLWPPKKTYIKSITFDTQVTSIPFTPLEFRAYNPWNWYAGDLHMKKSGTKATIDSFEIEDIRGNTIYFNQAKAPKIGAYSVGQRKTVIVTPESFQRGDCYQVANGFDENRQRIFQFRFTSSYPFNEQSLFRFRVNTSTTLKSIPFDKFTYEFWFKGMKKYDEDDVAGNPFDGEWTFSSYNSGQSFEVSVDHDVYAFEPLMNNVEKIVKTVNDQNDPQKNAIFVIDASFRLPYLLSVRGLGSKIGMECEYINRIGGDPLRLEGKITAIEEA